MRRLPKEIQRLCSLLERVIDVESWYGAANFGGAHTKANLEQGKATLERVILWARRNGFPEYAEKLENVRPQLSADLQQGVAALREVRISARLQLDAATDGLDLPRIPPASVTMNRPYTRTSPKISRNAPCPCGSGKKYKRCCGIPSRLS